MRLRTKVQLTLGLVAALLSLVAGILVWTLLDYRELRLAQQRVHMIKGHAAATNVLAMEYILRPTARIRQQWQNVQGQLVEVVDSFRTNALYRESAAEIASLSRQVAADFIDLNQDEDSPDSAAYKVRFNRLLADIQSMLSLADHLAVELDARQGRGEFLLTSVIAIAVTALISAGLLTYVALIPSIFRPMSSLLDGIRAFGRGEAVDLKERHADNEFGELARAFVEMQGRLAASRAELENAVTRTREVNEELRRSNGELDDFAYIAAHDLKEPLRATFNHARFQIEDYEDRLDEDGKKRLQRLIELSRRMEKLIADLLYYSRLGRGEAALEALDLHVVIANIGDDLAETLNARNAEVTVSGALPIVQGHRPHVTALFRNLISNGVKYNDADQKLIEIGHVADGREDTDDAFDTFYVKDNGIGIEEEFRDEIFRIFRRLNSVQAYGEGTGAGLSFAKKVVERQGGRIWLVSNPGEGTTVLFTLRRALEGLNAEAGRDAA
ncbi:MAG: ATP-binding protein [Alphaproteobacteria bacterium]|nr:ATP-binding protein [Alphaproteobacteria bacterium]